MEGALKLWVVILAVGAINYASRLSFIAFFARRTMPPLLARALRYVPAAMLMALIVPMIVTPAAGVEAINPRIPAAIVAGGRRVVDAQHAEDDGRPGMVALWLLQAALDAFAANIAVPFRGRLPCASKAPTPTSPRPT